MRGEFDLLHDALCDLSDNAVKASGAGQTVTLSAENGRIAVRDSGCGIPRDEIDNRTEPFYTVDRSRSGSDGGARLGLSIVKQIAQLHKARLEIESEPGKGTCVYIIFQ